MKNNKYVIGRAFAVLSLATCILLNVANGQGVSAIGGRDTTVWLDDNEVRNEFFAPIYVGNE